MSLRQTTLNISLERLRANYRALAKHGGANLCPVIKANAYGHGLIEVAQALTLENPAYLAVALCEEGVLLREAGIQSPILVLGPAPTDSYGYIIDHQLVPCISNTTQIEMLANAAQGKSLNYHLKVDTGMSRLGVALEDLSSALEKLASFPNLNMQGVLTHFANADLGDMAYSQKQIERFQQALQEITKSEFKPEIIHCSNSAATLDLNIPEQTMLRPGLALYGINPLGPEKPPIDIQPATLWRTSPLHIKTIPAHTPVSYGGTWQSEQETTLAVLPVGYADGYRREFSNRAEVLIDGARAPVIGKVCMDHTLVDVTHLPTTSLESEVVLMGKQGQDELSPWQLAQWAETIPYEILCGISARVKRTYDESLSP